MKPYSFTREETKVQIRHGRSDAHRLIEDLTQNPEAEIERRIKSPQNIFYYNKERQAKHE